MNTFRNGVIKEKVVNVNSNKELDVLQDYGFKCETHTDCAGYSVWKFDTYTNGKFTLVNSESKSEFSVACYTGNPLDYLGETDVDSTFVREFRSMDSIIKWININK